MRSHILLAISVSTLLASAALAQRGEIGAAGGGGFYTKQQITNRGASADASFQTGPAASAWVGQNVSRFIGGEIRYIFQQGKAQLTSAGTRAELSARTHTIHYDLLVHFADRKSRVRPFVLAGAGAKFYQGTGETRAVQALSNVALLTPVNQTRIVVTFGGGIKFQVTDHLQLRVDVRDYLSQFPDKVIAPRSGDSISSWIHNLVPLVGLAYTF